MDSPSFAGPGLLFVKARISKPEILSESQYMHWYDDDHIAEILRTSGISSAFRYIRSDKAALPASAYPYLALYPMNDIAFLKSEEFIKGIRVHSDLLPGSGLVYDLADNEVRYYKLLDIKDARKLGKGHTKTIIPAQFEHSSSISDKKSSGMQSWISESHVLDVSQLKGYLRSTTFELLYARTNAQSRKLKGLPVTEGDDKEPSPPRWLCMHEFECAEHEIDAPKLKELEKKAMTEAMSEVRMPMYGVARVHGEGDWFHEQE